jgi:nitrate reductase delta subunit
MNDIRAIYDALAGLLCYPGRDYRQRLASCQRALAEHHSEADERLRQFEQTTADFSETQFEELFTQTFDLNPICSLEVGWHLFGENYSRGEFLVEMRGHLRACGLPESSELPDHLTHVLAALCRMNHAQADRFTMTYLLPALEKMLTGLAGRDNPYEHVLEAIRAVLLSPYGAVL